jgi:hypothetical protein
MSAVPPAVSPVVANPFAFSNLQDVPLGEPMGEVATEYPGILSGQHDDPNYQQHASPELMPADIQAVYGPDTPFAWSPYSGHDISAEQGGIERERGDWENHDGYAAPWDSNAGIPFAGGAGGEGLSDGLHAIGHGSDLKFHELPPDIGSPFNLRIANESFAPQIAYDPVDGKQQSAAQAAGNRSTSGAGTATSNFDGYTAHDEWYSNTMRDYMVPRWTKYEERPIYNNLAAVGQPINEGWNSYGISGMYPDQSNQFSDHSEINTTPPDPAVQATPAYDSPSIGGQWVGI